jgi:hypothetical protein
VASIRGSREQLFEWIAKNEITRRNEQRIELIRHLVAQLLGDSELATFAGEEGPAHNTPPDSRSELHEAEG